MACGHVACPGHETCNCQGKELAVSLDFRNCEENKGNSWVTRVSTSFSGEWAGKKLQFCEVCVLLDIVMYAWCASFF